MLGLIAAAFMFGFGFAVYRNLPDPVVASPMFALVGLGLAVTITFFLGRRSGRNIASAAAWAQAHAAAAAEAHQQVNVAVTQHIEQPRPGAGAPLAGWRSDAGADELVAAPPLAIALQRAQEVRRRSEVSGVAESGPTTPPALPAPLFQVSESQRTVGPVLNDGHSVPEVGRDSIFGRLAARFAAIAVGDRNPALLNEGHRSITQESHRDDS